MLFLNLISFRYLLIQNLLIKIIATKENKDISWIDANIEIIKNSISDEQSTVFSSTITTRTTVKPTEQSFKIEWRDSGESTDFELIYKLPQTSQIINSTYFSFGLSLDKKMV